MLETQQEAENGILKAPNLYVVTKQCWSHHRSRKTVQASVRFIKRVLDWHNRKCVLWKLHLFLIFTASKLVMAEGNANSLLRSSLYRNRDLSNHAKCSSLSFLQCFNLLSYTYRLFSEATEFFFATYQTATKMLYFIIWLHTSNHVCFSFWMYFTQG